MEKTNVESSLDRFKFSGDTSVSIRDKKRTLEKDTATSTIDKPETGIKMSVESKK